MEDERAPRRGSLVRGLVMALAVMLLPLAAVAALGTFAFQSTVDALEEFRDESLGETVVIDAIRSLLDEADDVARVHAAQGTPGAGERFADLADEIRRRFAELSTMTSPQERPMTAAARVRWETAVTAVEAAAAGSDPAIGDPLTTFHEQVELATGLLANIDAANASEIAEQIASLRGREQRQLAVSIGTLITGTIACLFLSRRIYRSIATPLGALELAASRFASDDLSHRIEIRGHDELTRVAIAFNDMATQLQQSREELNHRALHDPLTDLPNRALFMERMERALARSRRRGTPVSVLYIDLDGFKAVNDTLGHEAGDEVLISVAAHLRDCLRDEDTVARLGGDEFGVLLEEDLRGACRLAERLTMTLQATWSIASGDVPVGASIGVATREHDEELDQLLRQADAAMYAAKAAGKGRWHVFTPDLDAEIAVTASLHGDLQRAVEHHEFVAHYQPVVDLRSGGVVGVEALVRWNHPVRGLLVPAAFLPEAEEGGQIVFIDRWVVREACRQVREWQRSIPGAERLSVHVNLSARQLQFPGLAEEIADALEATGLRPEDLVLEITETTLVRDAEAAASELTRLKALRVRLALDDFGTGFSSLSHLLRFPIDAIKIDRAFVTAVGGDGQRSALVPALVNLGRTLRLRVVAEGIEDAEQLAYLRSSGCQLGQGYYFARPMPPDDLARFLAASGSERSNAPEDAGIVLT